MADFTLAEAPQPAATAAFLASEKASSITGPFVNVTSGMFPS
jgi:enoyl-[acyl-carrier-protein] reductase (NADH)